MNGRMQMTYTCERRGSSRKSSLRESMAQIVAVSVKNTVLLGFGMTLGFPTILVFALSDPAEPFNTGVEELSWLGSLNLIFVPIGCLLSGPLSQKLGRKSTIQLANVPLIFIWLLFKFSTDIWQVYLGLAASGLLLGCIEASVITYVAEVTTPKLRGILSSTSTMFAVMGVLLELILGAFFRWRDAAILSLIVPLISINTLILVPESPRWLLMKKKFDDAKHSLAWLRGCVAFEEVEKEYNQMIEELKDKQTLLERSNRRSSECCLRAYTKRTFLLPFSLVTFLFFLRHFTGITNVQTYGLKLFCTFDVAFDSYYTTVLMGVVELLGCITCILIIRKTGRRTLAFVTILCSAVCLSGIATYSLLKGVDDLRIIDYNKTGIGEDGVLGVIDYREIGAGNDTINIGAVIEEDTTNGVVGIALNHPESRVAADQLIDFKIERYQKPQTKNLFPVSINNRTRKNYTDRINLNEDSSQNGRNQTPNCERTQTNNTFSLNDSTMKNITYLKEDAFHSRRNQTQNHEQSQTKHIIPKISNSIKKNTDLYTEYSYKSRKNQTQNLLLLKVDQSGANQAVTSSNNKRMNNIGKTKDLVYQSNPTRHHLNVDDLIPKIKGPQYSTEDLNSKNQISYKDQTFNLKPHENSNSIKRYEEDFSTKTDDYNVEETTKLKDFANVGGGFIKKLLNHINDYVSRNPEVLKNYSFGSDKNEIFSTKLDYQNEKSNIKRDVHNIKEYISTKLEDYKYEDFSTNVEDYKNENSSTELEYKNENGNVQRDDHKKIKFSRKLGHKIENLIKKPQNLSKILKDYQNEDISGNIKREDFSTKPEDYKIEDFSTKLQNFKINYEDYNNKEDFRIKSENINENSNLKQDDHKNENFNTKQESYKIKDFSTNLQYKNEDFSVKLEDTKNFSTKLENDKNEDSNAIPEQYKIFNTKFKDNKNEDVRQKTENFNQRNYIENGDMLQKAENFDHEEKQDFEDSVRATNKIASPEKETSASKRRPKRSQNSTSTTDLRKFENWIPTGLLLVFSFFSHAGLRILPWILTGEIFTPETRSVATGITTATAYVLGFVANKLFLYACSALTLPGVFYLFSSLSVAGVVVLYFVLPETEGKTLTEIRKYFERVKEVDERIPNDLYAISWDLVVTEDATTYKRFTEVDTAF